MDFTEISAYVSYLYYRQCYIQLMLQFLEQFLDQPLYSMQLQNG